MDKIESGKSPFSELHHIGFIVRDADKVAEYYESLGLGPFERLTPSPKERILRGKPADDLKLKIRMAHVSPLRFELIEPVTGEGSIWKEFLESKGEGISHVAFLVDDIDKAEAELVEKGYKVIFRVRFANGGGTTYFETNEIGGVIFEFFQRPDDYVKHD